MPIDYKGYTVPELDDGANANVAFKQFADSVVAAGGGGVPVGCVMPYVGDTAPDADWKICDGQELDATVYSELFAVIGAKFGTASAGYFKLPDMRGAVPRGAGNSGLGGGWAGGAVGAAPTAPQSVTLTTAHMPSHTHAQSAHSHSATFSGSGTATDAGSHEHYVSGSTATDGHHRHLYYETTAVSNTNTSGGGSLTRVSSLDAKWSNTFFTLPDEVKHSHAIGLNSQANGSHAHGVSVTGTVSVPVGGGGDQTGAAGSGSPTALNMVGPAVSLNYIIKVKP